MLSRCVPYARGPWFKEELRDCCHAREKEAQENVLDMWGLLFFVSRGPEALQVVICVRDFSLRGCYAP